MYRNHSLWWHILVCQEGCCHSALDSLGQMRSDVESASPAFPHTLPLHRREVREPRLPLQGFLPIILCCKSIVLALTRCPRCCTHTPTPVSRAHVILLSSVGPQDSKSLETINNQVNGRPGRVSGARKHRSSVFELPGAQTSSQTGRRKP